MILNGKIIAAACCHLAIHDIHGCIIKLLRGNELFHGFVIGYLFPTAMTLEIYK